MADGGDTDLTYYFLWPDYVVLSLMLTFSAAIGVYYACTGGKQKTTKEYLLADGNMHWFPVACSLLASYISTNTLIGTPAEVYTFGSVVWYGAFALGLGAVLGEAFFLPIYEQLKIVSLFQYIQLRFGRPLKLIVVIASLISMLLYAALVIYGPALSVAAVTGIDIWISIFSIALISMLYTTIGGLKAVLWTDAFQLCIMLSGVSLVLIYGINVQEGGFAGVWQAAKLSGRLDLIESRMFDYDPRVRNTFWGVILNRLVIFTGFYGCNQTSVQRFLSLRSRSYKKIAYLFAALGCCLLWSMSCLVGLTIFGYFKVCDPLITREIFTKDQLYPLFVMRLFRHLPGLPGFILSALFSASLSTISSLLNSGALIILEDFVKPCRPGLTDKKAAIISKVVAFSLGLVSLVLVVFIKFSGKGILKMSAVFHGMFGGPIVGLFTAGMFLPIANNRGAIIGFMSGALYGGMIGVGGIIAKPYRAKYPTTSAGCNITDTMLLANISSPVFDPVAYDPRPHYKNGFMALFDQSYNWTSVSGFLVTFLVVLIASMILAQKDDPPVNKYLLSPYLRSRCCLMPASWRARIDEESEPPISDTSRAKMNGSDEIGQDGSGAHEVDAIDTHM